MDNHLNNDKNRDIEITKLKEKLKVIENNQNMNTKEIEQLKEKLHLIQMDNSRTGIIILGIQEDIKRLLNDFEETKKRPILLINSVLSGVITATLVILIQQVF